MINYLKGKVKFAKKEYISLEVNGVGYKVEVIQNELFNESQDIELFISTVVREDSIRFFGFTTREQMEVFESLISVSGVGPKIALALLEIGSDKIIDAIIDQNLSTFKVKGVGAKTLEKITIELRGKLNLHSGVKESRSGGDNIDDVVNALVNLGFAQREIEEAIKHLSKEEKLKDPSEVIKIVLKNLRVK